MLRNRPCLSSTVIIFVIVHVLYPIVQGHSQVVKWFQYGQYIYLHIVWR